MNLKPTLYLCKNDHIHIYSYRDTNTKRGIIIGFYLRALRISFLTYLDDEFNFVENSFLNLLYSKPFIQFAKSKALKIHQRKRSQAAINTPNVISLPKKNFAFILHQYKSRVFRFSLFWGKLILNCYNISNFNWFSLPWVPWIKFKFIPNSILYLSLWTIRSNSFSLPFFHFFSKNILTSFLSSSIISLRNPTNFMHNSTCQLRNNIFKNENAEYTVMNLSFYTHFFLLLFHQTSILTTLFMNLKSRRRLL